jgi:tryptophanyl-tRNA synthetase
MASDILIHRAKNVPVGKDQEQQLEIARNYEHRFNHRYGEVFPEPYAFNFGSELIKVPSLDGTGKMSKSENQYATLYLSDEDELIRKKVMKAKTDSGPAAPGSEMSLLIQNLFQMMQLVSEESTVEKFKNDFATASIRYGDVKKQLAEDMVRFITPIRERATEIYRDKAYLQKIMKDGAEKARISARKTIESVREAIGLNFF